MTEAERGINNSTQLYTREQVEALIAEEVEKAKEKENSRLFRFIHHYLKVLKWKEGELEYLKKEWRHSDMTKEEIENEGFSGVDYWN